MSLPTCPKCGCQLEVKLIYASGPRVSQQTTNEDIGSILEEAEAKPQHSDFETEFLLNIREKFDKYGSAIRLSERQLEILRRIAHA